MYRAIARDFVKSSYSVPWHLPRIPQALSPQDSTPQMTHAQLEAKTGARRLQTGLVGSHLDIVEGGRDVKVARRNVPALRGTLGSTASACGAVGDRRTYFGVN